MRQVPKKNYVILCILLVIVVIVTLSLSNMYKTKNRETTSFYNYANKISSVEFNEYMIENPDTIIYMSDKYDLSTNDFEKNFENRLNLYNMRDRFVYIDTNTIDDDFINKFNEKYNVLIRKSEYPIIIVMSENKLLSIIYVDINNYDIDTLINYEDLK